MVDGETFKIKERSTETILGDTSGGRRDLSNRYSAPIKGGKKIDVESSMGKLTYACGGVKLWMLLFKLISMLF